MKKVKAIDEKMSLKNGMALPGPSPATCSTRFFVLFIHHIEISNIFVTLMPQ